MTGTSEPRRSRGRPAKLAIEFAGHLLAVEVDDFLQVKWAVESLPLFVVEYRRLRLANYQRHGAAADWDPARDAAFSRATERLWSTLGSVAWPPSVISRVMRPLSAEYKKSCNKFSSKDLPRHKALRDTLVLLVRNQDEDTPGTMAALALYDWLTPAGKPLDKHSDHRWKLRGAAMGLAAQMSGADHKRLERWRCYFDATERTIFSQHCARQFDDWSDTAERIFITAGEMTADAAAEALRRLAAAERRRLRMHADEADYQKADRTAA